VTKEKVNKIMTRRRSRRPPARAQENKENDGENLFQSPTPYWKVAKERGKNTPPETRSAKKQKSDGGKKLNFSPEEDKENARCVLSRNQNSKNSRLL
jgi:hypothetical protein